MSAWPNFLRVLRNSQLQKHILLGLVIGMALLFAPTFSLAQGLSGITGTITDTSGAVVPGVTITITNNDTNVVHTAVSTSVGTYFVTDLNPGTYTVKFEKSGFSTEVQRHVNVDANTTSTANATLRAGVVNETIEITAPEITLQTDQPQIGTVIQPELVNELPTLIGGGPGNVGARDRQIDDYIFLTPGVSGGEFEHRINGGIGYQNEVMFNGVVAVQSETQGFQSNINPPFELVSEINVISGNFGAQYGLAQGVASYRFASGTNQLHGDVFEVVRNTVFDAAGADPPGSSYASPTDFIKGPVPTINQNNYGFSVGGPVYLPKLYDGRNKTFFHVSLDWFKQNLTGGSPNTVPTQQMVGGDFSQLCSTGFTAGVCNDRDSSGNVMNQIYVPQNFTGAAVPSGCTPPAPGQPWPGDVIPTSCFSAISKSVLNLIPSVTGSALIKNSPSQVGVLPIRQTNGGFTVDQNFGEKTAFHVAWWRDLYNLTSCCNVGGAFNNALTGAETEPRIGTGFFLTASHEFSSSLIMTAGFGWMGEINNELNYKNGVSFAGVTDSSTFPTIHFNGNAGQPWTPTSWGLNSDGETFSKNRKLGLSFDNNWLYIHGRNTYNIGLEIRRSYQDDHECQACGGGFNFNAITTADPNNQLGETGAAFASFLLGDVDNAFRKFVAENRLRNLYFAPYIQDAFKVSPKLTVNAGIRWDIMRPFLENDNNVTFFDATSPNPGAISTVTGDPLLGSAAKLGVGSGLVGYRRADIHWKDFSPRIGFTYQLNNKTVVLGGFAINFLDQGPYEYGNNKISVDYGSLSNGFIAVNSTGSNVPGYGIWDGNPLGVPTAQPFSPSLFDGQNIGLYQFSKNPGPNSYVQMWNIGVQRELSGNILVSASYVGNRGVHLLSMLNPINQTNPKYLTQFCPSGVASDPTCLMSPASPNFAWNSAPSQAALQSLGFGTVTYPAGTCGATTVTLYVPYANFCQDWGLGFGLPQALLPYPEFKPSESAGGLANQFNMAGSSLYNAMQLQAQKRWSGGMTFLVNYTLSKLMANTDSGFASFNFGGLNAFNPQQEWTVASVDQRQVINITGVYELPLGPGKKFAHSGGLLAKNLLGGWQISVGFAYASGLPVNTSGAGSQDSGIAITANTDPYLNGFNFANYNPSVPLNVNFNNYYKGLPVFNTAAFSDPGFRGGDAPRLINALRLPWTQNENVGIAKHFYFTERVNMEIRGEFFNVFNRMQICGPDVGVDDGANFGIVSPGSACQANSPRQGLINAKITF
jgi:hypothetical protein